MINDVIIIDNIFSDPRAVVDYAKRQTYYTVDNHPDAEKRQSNWNGLNWTGHRTDKMFNVDPDTFRGHMNEIVTGALANFLLVGGDTIDRFNVGYNYKAHSCFHYLTRHNICTESQYHRDGNALIAGVVYLQENPAPDSGTVVYRENGQRIVVDNVFNRLVLYRASYLHGPQGSFGNTIDDGRLTYTLFFVDLQLDIQLRRGSSD